MAEKKAVKKRLQIVLNDEEHEQLVRFVAQTGISQQKVLKACWEVMNAYAKPQRKGFTIVIPKPVSVQVRDVTIIPGD